MFLGSLLYLFATLLPVFTSYFHCPDNTFANFATAKTQPCVWDSRDAY